MMQSRCFVKMLFLVLNAKQTMNKKIESIGNKQSWTWSLSAKRLGRNKYVSIEWCKKYIVMKGTT